MYRLPDHLRPELRRIIGVLVEDEHVEARIDTLLDDHTPIIAVGDVTTMRLLGLGRNPAVCILDGSTRRGVFRDVPTIEKRCAEKGYRVVVVHNPPATLTGELFDAIREALGQFDAKMIYTLIKVVGEEDLASLACIALAKEGARVVFGVPGKGLQVVEVKQSTKSFVREILRKMEDYTHEHSDH